MVAAERLEQELQEKIQRKNAEFLRAAHFEEEMLHSLAVQKAWTKEERIKLTSEKKVSDVQ